MDEVAPNKIDGKQTVDLFGDLLKICKSELKLERLPKINWLIDREFNNKYHSFGSFVPHEDVVNVTLIGRHPIDIMRTLAHELVHYRQMLDGRIKPDSGETGSEIENEAHAIAGVIMRKFDHMHPEAFELNPLMEHVVEVGNVYGEKNIPELKEKVNSKDKGKIHKALRISEVLEHGTPKVYVDMDGVLADFFKDWTKMAKVNSWKDIQNPEAALDLIRNHPTFWIDLDVLSNAPRLIGGIKKFAGSYYICTSPLGKDPNCEPQKREWVKKHLSAFSPKEVYVTHNKPQFATQADGTPNILIDDFGKNIRAWEAAGGIGIHYENKNVDKALKALKDAMTPGLQDQTTSDSNPQANVDKK